MRCVPEHTPARKATTAFNIKAMTVFNILPGGTGASSSAAQNGLLYNDDAQTGSFLLCSKRLFVVVRRTDRQTAAVLNTSLELVRRDRRRYTIMRLDGGWWSSSSSSSSWMDAEIYD